MAKYDRKFTSFAQYDKFFIILEDFENNWIEKLDKMDYWKVIELLVETAAGAKDKEDNFFYAFFIESIVNTPFRTILPNSTRNDGNIIENE